MASLKIFQENGKCKENVIVKRLTFVEKFVKEVFIQVKGSDFHRLIYEFIV